MGKVNIIILLQYNGCIKTAETNQKKMKRYKDIVIDCGDCKTALKKLDSIKSACTVPEFTHNEELEKMYAPDDNMAHILVDISGLPKAVMVVWANDGKIKVINIVPFKSSVSQIEVDIYNQIIECFYEKILGPIFINQYKVDISSGDYSISDIIPKSFDALNLWTSCPGAPDSPFSHPSDLKRWFEFLCQMTINREELFSDQLEQWLREEKNWPDDIVHETNLKYEEEMELLNYYDNRNN